jgi:single-stranded DNA-binding protein
MNPKRLKVGARVISAPEDAVMVNKVLLLGTVDQLKMPVEADGRTSTLFTLRYEEAYGQGQIAKLFVPVEVAPSRSEAVGESIAEGGRVLVDGRVKWRAWIDKKGEKQGKLAVLAWNVTVLQPATVQSSN